MSKGKEIAIPSNQKSQELSLFTGNIPVVSKEKKWKLVRVDGSQAHFVDSDRNKWYFDSGRRLWREINIMDFHPMALQFTRPEKPEKSVFDSTEDAALAALKVFFWQSVELDEPLDADMRVKYQSYTNRKRELLNLITDMENTQDINIKAKLRKKIAENL